jgi:hypothetical protein
MTVSALELDAVIAEAKEQVRLVLGEPVYDSMIIRALAGMVALQRASLSRMAGDVSPGYVRANPTVTPVLNLDGKKPL